MGAWECAPVSPVLLGLTKERGISIVGAEGEQVVLTDGYSEGSGFIGFVGCWSVCENILAVVVLGVFNIVMNPFELVDKKLGRNEIVWGAGYVDGIINFDFVNSPFVRLERQL